MTPSLDWRGLKKPAAWEYALRFAFGGLVAVATGLVSHFGGPKIGGIFLAFPAILPATLTLVKRHDGRGQAVEEARGARLGSPSLIVFAVVVLVLRDTSPVLALLCATVAWTLVTFAAWGLGFGRRVR